MNAKDIKSLHNIIIMRRGWIYFALFIFFASYAMGSMDGSVVDKHSSLGLPEETWSRNFGNFLFPDMGHTIEEYDDGYIAGGMTIRFPYLEQYGWLLKLDDRGRMKWSIILKNMEDLIDVEIVSDGIIAGGYGKDGDLKILKIDPEGNMIWEKSFGGEYLEILKKDGCITETKDGGYAVLSTTWSFSDDKGADMWLLKLERDGNMEWEMVYGKREDADIGYGVIEVEDGYIIVGQSFSFNYTDSGIIIKVDENGNIIWEKRMGNSLYSVSSKDGCYVVTGNLWDEKESRYVFLMAEVEKNGSITWLKTYDDLPSEGGYSMDKADDGFIACGNGESSITVVKLDGDGNEIWKEKFDGIGWRRAECIKKVDDGFILVGGKTSFPWLFPYFLDLWVMKIQ